MLSKALERPRKIATDLSIRKQPDTRDAQSFNQAYQNGLNEERRVKMFFQNQGCRVFGSSYEENVYDDIDCWVDNVPVSIKAQHAALKYPRQTFYFETEQQLTADSSWHKTGWFYQGKAQVYAILQGNELSILDVAKVKAELANRATQPEWAETDGFSYVRSLSAAVRKTQGGSYRFSDARCGYIYKPELPVEEVYYL